MSREGAKQGLGLDVAPVDPRRIVGPVPPHAARQLNAAVGLDENALSAALDSNEAGAGLQAGHQKGPILLLSPERPCAPPSLPQNPSPVNHRDSVQGE
jgi:hypothetical protein